MGGGGGGYHKIFLRTSPIYYLCGWLLLLKTGAAQTVNLSNRPAISSRLAKVICDSRQAFATQNDDDRGVLIEVPKQAGNYSTTTLPCNWYRKGPCDSNICKNPTYHILPCHQKGSGQLVDVYRKTGGEKAIRNPPGHPYPYHCESFGEDLCDDEVTDAICCLSTTNFKCCSHNGKSACCYKRHGSQVELDYCPSESIDKPDGEKCKADNLNRCCQDGEGGYQCCPKNYKCCYIFERIGCCLDNDDYERWR